MKPSLPKGTRDFLPQAVTRRNYLMDTIATVFRRYGYAPIETPAMENLATLTGKYGEEGDRLLFRVLNNGDYLDAADKDALRRMDSAALAPSIAKRGMRYDLTVPFARFVVMHQNDLTFPFKRYQIQPVWRADRPQKGRYQEFYQCDVDVVGSTSLLYEAELVQIYDTVFAALGLHVTIRLNNRKVLTGIAEVCGTPPSQITAMTTAIDKWEKIGMEGVRTEMEKRGIASESISLVLDILQTESPEALSSHLSASDTGMKGVHELNTVFSFLKNCGLHNPVVFDVKLARGLDYYTGCILEVSARDAEMGSLGGGGRYDDLTGVFGMPGVSGVGISFGAERIYDVMETLNLFPASLTSAPHVVFLSMTEAALQFAFDTASQLRNAGIPCDVYPEAVKLQKQMRYANQLGCRFAAIIGDEELERGAVMLRDLQSGDQMLVTTAELAIELKSRS